MLYLESLNYIDNWMESRKRKKNKYLDFSFII